MLGSMAPGEAFPTCYTTISIPNINIHLKHNTTKDFNTIMECPTPMA
jgi:hypothetical protein